MPATFMEIISDPKQIQSLCAGWRCGRQSLGFVPTMGALHAGHYELFRRARNENDRLIGSLYVNPTQFGPREDLDKYPRTFEQDCEMLREVGCDALFAPTTEDMYGSKTDLLHGTWIDVTPFDELWEGVTRPGHLRGVATIVAKLFNITQPTRAYFGEKDFQQLCVVETMVRDLNFDLEVVGVQTVREADGLAMSSRNRYLSPPQREAAGVIFRAMTRAIELARGGEKDVTRLGEAMSEIFAQEPMVKPQYVTIVNAQTLAPIRELDEKPARILVAAHLGSARLIDNLPIQLGSSHSIGSVI